MNRADRKRWRSARTAEDLGELVIAWLNGQVRETPGHEGGPCAETIPLIPLLTRVNRAGFVTDDSQDAGSRDGRAWNAQVSGFASDKILARLEIEAEAPLLLTACRGTDHDCRLRAQEWWHCPWKDCADFWAASCPHAAEEIYSSWYVCISDPVPGRNDVLWPALEWFAR